MKWIRKNSNLILSIFLVVSTVAFFGPLELYFTNSEEFWFEMKDILIMAGLLSLVSILVLFGIGMLTKGKGREIYSMLLFAVGLALYIQGNYANINYGVLDGGAIDWSSYSTYAILDTVGWLIFIVAIIFFWVFKRQLFQMIQKYSVLFILAIQLVTLVTLVFMTDATKEKSNYYLSDEGIYEVSENENVIVFILDAFDDAYWQEVYSQDSKRYDEVFCDFTYFNNAVVAAARTRAALPAIVTGETYPGKVSYAEYIEEAFDRDGLYSELKKKDYNIGIYANSIYVPDNSEDIVQNQVNSGYRVSSYTGLASKYFELTLYKYVPHVLKRFFWMYTGDFDAYKSGGSRNTYNVDDVAFYEGMKLKAVEDNVFRLYYLNGAHSPYTYDENVEKQDADTTLLQQAKGALKIVEDYIHQMKSLGVYDNSTIIVMADHGEVNEEYDVLNAAHGIFFVKQRNHSAEFKESSAPVSYLDLHPTIFSEIGIDKGKSVFDITEDESRTRYYYFHSYTAGRFCLEEYIVEGNINDNDAIKYTGRVLSPDVESMDYIYGTQLTFGPNSNALPYIVTGISGTDEGNYAWTSGKECVFQVPLERMPSQNLKVTMNLASVYTANGPQEVKISVNGMVYYYEFLSKAKDIQFVLPKDICQEDEPLYIEMALPSAISPEAVFGGGRDARVLALAVSGLKIEETEAAVSEMPDIQYEIPVLTKYDFGADGNVADYLLDGWHASEEGKNWSSGNAKLWVKADSEMDYKITLKYRIYEASGSTTVSVGSNVLANLDGKDSEVTFTVSKEMIKNNAFVLSFDTPGVVSPKEQGTGADERKLGVCIFEMEVIPFTVETLE